MTAILHFPPARRRPLFSSSAHLLAANVQVVERRRNVIRSAMCVCVCLCSVQASVIAQDTIFQLQIPFDANAVGENSFAWEILWNLYDVLNVNPFHFHSVRCCRWRLATRAKFWHKWRWMQQQCRWCWTIWPPVLHTTSVWWLTHVSEPDHIRSRYGFNSILSKQKHILSKVQPQCTAWRVHLNISWSRTKN